MTDLEINRFKRRLSDERRRRAWQAIGRTSKGGLPRWLVRLNATIGRMLCRETALTNGCNLGQRPGANL
jgi:hypothetical protein